MVARPEESTFEFAVLAAPGAKRLEERSIRLKHLDTVVSGVANNDVALIINRYTPGEKGREMMPRRTMYYHHH